jgi:hypothetical protein
VAQRIDVKGNCWAGTKGTMTREHSPDFERKMQDILLVYRDVNSKCHSDAPCHFYIDISFAETCPYSAGYCELIKRVGRHYKQLL